MATGDSVEMQRMQEAALKRAREMYERAQNSGQEKSNQETPSAPSESQAKPQEVRKPIIPPPSESLGKPPEITTGGNPLDFLMQDKERTLILLLLIMLSEEGNNELMFSLMYLLL